MVADIVNNQVDFTTLQNFTPQQNSLKQNESFSINKKSFDDLVHEARQNLEKPVEKNESVEKENNPADKNDVQAAKKPSDEKKTVKDSKTAAEKTEVKSEKTVQTDKKSIKSTLVKANDAEISEKADVSGVKKLDKAEKKEISFKKLEEVLENAKKLAADEDEKSALSVEDIKLLLEDDQETLAAMVNASEVLVAKQEETVQLPQLSENIFDSTDEVSDIKPKVFAFDKEGKIIVKDFRTEVESAAEKQTGDTDKNGLKITDVKFDGNNNAEITMDLAANVQQNLVSSTDQAASADGSNFQAMLSNQIQQNAGEIVKAGSIVLKDNNVGSIKLILHPEALGNVKIDLQINDKSISGKIIVASQEAFNAFKDSSDNLKQAFMDMGYDSAGLELSFAGQNGNGQQFKQEENPAKRFAMNQAYGGLNEAETVEFIPEEILGKSSKNSVNIVA